MHVLENGVHRARETGDEVDKSECKAAPPRKWQLLERKEAYRVQDEISLPLEKRV